MKTSKFLTIFFIVATFLITGCTQNESQESLENSEGLQVAITTENGEAISTQTVNRSLRNNSSTEGRSPNGNHVAIGDYISPSSGSPTEFSAVQNNGGVHGDWFVDSSVYGELHARTLCVWTNENDEAVVAYLIESVENPSASGFFQVNNIVFVQYKDNGEGSNASLDADSNYVLVYTNWFVIYNTPEEFLADGFSCEEHYNDPRFEGYREVPGQIQVNPFSANPVNDPNYIRGVRVTIPLFDPTPVQVPTGSWVTIAFSIQGGLNPGACPGELSQSQIDNIVDGAITFFEDSDVGVSFDGNPIDMPSNLLEDGISTVINNDGDCQYILPWRFYVNPQRPGTYTVLFSFEGVDYERTVTWGNN